MRGLGQLMEGFMNMMRGKPWREENWKVEGNSVIAPCGCKATGLSFMPKAAGIYSLPQDSGKLQFNGFADCGLIGDFCRFQSKTRALSFRQDIPLDSEIWEFYQEGQNLSLGH